MNKPHIGQRTMYNSTARCPECFRVFDLMNEVDAEEWYYGHDCEEV
jgi:hypothetical protein